MASSTQPPRVGGEHAERRGEQSSRAPPRRRRGRARCACPRRPARRRRCPGRSCRRSGASDGRLLRVEQRVRRSGRASRSAARRAATATIAGEHDHARSATSGCASRRRSHSGSPGSRRRRARGTGRPSGTTAARGGLVEPDRLDLRHAFRLARAHARVEDEVEDVHDEVRDDHADREHEQQRPASAGSRCRARPAASVKPAPG